MDMAVGLRLSIKCEHQRRLKLQQPSEAQDASAVCARDTRAMLPAGIGKILWGCTVWGVSQDL